MTTNEARQHALGYAAGREDASGVRTAGGPNGASGFIEFAEAFATAQRDYNDERRYNMTNARDAYDAWQISNGSTIFRR